MQLSMYRYGLGLLVLAVLVLASHVIDRSVVVRQHEDVVRIELAGQHRTLTARLVRTVLVAHHDPVSAGSLGSLGGLLDRWRRSRQLLRFGGASLHAPTSHVVARLDALKELADGIDEQADVAVAELAAGDLEAVWTAGVRLSELDEAYVSGMDEVVAQVAGESRARAEMAVWLDLLLATLMVAVVTIEAVMVLRPAVRRLREGQAWLRGLLQHASDLIFVFDEDDEVAYASPAVQRLLGSSAPHTRRQLERLTTTVSDARRLREAIEAMDSESTEARFPLSLLGPVGRRVDLIAQVSTLPDSGQVVLSARDVSHLEEARRSAEGELRGALQRERELSSMRHVALVSLRDLLDNAVNDDIVMASAAVADELVTLSERAEVDGEPGPMARWLRDDAEAKRGRRRASRADAVTGRDALKVLKGGQR